MLAVDRLRIDLPVQKDLSLQLFSILFFVPSVKVYQCVELSYCLPKLNDGTNPGSLMTPRVSEAHQIVSPMQVSNQQRSSAIGYE